MYDRIIKPLVLLGGLAFALWGIVNLSIRSQGVKESYPQTDKHPESYYQAKWCLENDGTTEVVLPDRTRCDCVTLTFAVEFDFAPKWAESIGQSLNYAIHTGKKPAIGLIVLSDKDLHYKAILERVIKEYDLGIELFIIR